MKQGHVTAGKPGGHASLRGPLKGPKGRATQPGTRYVHLPVHVLCNNVYVISVSACNVQHMK